MSKPKKFSEKLRKMRQTRRSTQSELAAKVGVSLRTIQNWEKGAKLPKEAVYYDRIADYFGVTMDYLTDDDEEECEYAVLPADVMRAIDDVIHVLGNKEIEEKYKNYMMGKINLHYFSDDNQIE